MPRCRATLVAMAVCLLPSAALAEKAGGTLRVPLTGNPPSLSIHEESTVMTIFPMMSVMSNLVIYDQHEPQNRLDNIRPDLAESWTWSDDRTDLTFKLRARKRDVERKSVSISVDLGVARTVKKKKQK